MKVLAVRAELCVACGVCEEVCATTFFKVSDRDRSAIRVSVPDAPDVDCQLVFCDQCGECIAVCPTGALFRTKSGIVRLRKKDCVGCMSCVAFCPSLAMAIHPDDNVPFKCVACGKCAEQCPTDALYMTEVDVPPEITELTRSIRSKTGETPHGH
jgi:carbon-monoxide dehydrogenase iron sulfur subunit